MTSPSQALRITATTMLLAVVVGVCGNPESNDSAAEGTPSSGPSTTTVGVSSTIPDTTAPVTSTAPSEPPPELYLQWASILVNGFGGGGAYLYFPDRELAADVYREYAAEDLFDEEALGEFPEFGSEMEIKDAAEGGCLIDPLLPPRWESGDWSLEPDEAVFDASFRFDQTEYVSIADNGDNVHGGFAVGSVSRSDSEQWDIFGDEGSMVYEVSPADIGSMSFVTVVARWQGISVENFSGEEAAGSVTVKCMFST